jgi:hypothetical protein
LADLDGGRKDNGEATANSSAALRNDKQKNGTMLAVYIPLRKGREGWGTLAFGLVEENRQRLLGWDEAWVEKRISPLRNSRWSCELLRSK